MILITDKSNSLFKNSLEDNFPVFFTKEYDNFLQNKNQQLVIAYSDVLHALMPFRLWKSQFLKIATCLYQPLSNGNALSQKDEKTFLNEFIKELKKKNICDRISAADNTAVFNAYPEHSIHAPFGTYKLNLYPNTYENVLASFQARYRTAIRQAQSNQIRIEYGKKVLHDFYNLHQITMCRSKMHIQPIEYFQNYFDSLPNNTLLSVAYENQNPIGALLITYTKHSAQYLYGCSSEHTVASGAIKYLHAHAMKQLIDNKVLEYDFVGARLTELNDSKLKGIQEFKSRFGTTLHKGYNWKKDLNKTKCAVYDRLLKSKLKIQNTEFPVDLIEQELKNTQTKDEKIKISTLIRNLKKEVQKSDLTAQFKKIGICEGDVLLVHSSLSKIGNVKNGAQSVIEALLEVITSSGTLNFPTFSYQGSMLNTIKDKDFIFSTSETKSVVGNVSETFRKMPEVIRSEHPTHSIASLGPEAKNITKGHLLAETTFGPGTPFDIIRQKKGKLLGLGIGIGPVTMYHSIEDFYPKLFNDVYLPESHTLKVKTKSGIIDKKIFVHRPKHDRIDKNPAIELWFTKHLTQKKILHVGPIGNGTMWWMDIQQLFDEILELKKQNISIYKVPIE